MVKRYDRIELQNVRKNDNGFLTYDFIAAQTGVFPYFDFELGKVVYELKHPDDLLTDEVAQQLCNIPITEDHPWELVTTDNAKEYVKGMTNNSAGIKGNKLAGQGTVFDSGLIGKVLNGNKKECSLGFTCVVVDESGVYDGKPYDRRQTEFSINHLAMVTEARCGPECSAKLDSKEVQHAIQIRMDEIEKYKNSEGEVKTMKYKLDGIEYDIPEVVANKLDSLSSDNTKLTKEVGSLEGKLDGKNDVIKKQDEKITELEKNTMSTEKLDEAIEQRLELAENARIILGDEYDFAGKTNQEIKVDCIKESLDKEFKADGKSEDYINARFDTLVDFLNKESSSIGDNNLKFVKKSDGSGLEEKKRKRLNMNQ